MGNIRILLLAIFLLLISDAGLGQGLIKRDNKARIEHARNNKKKRRPGQHPQMIPGLVTKAIPDSIGTAAKDTIETAMQEPARQTMQDLQKQSEFLNEIVERIISNMIYVEGGEFLMGAPDGPDLAKPVHMEAVKSFNIGKYEVTQKEWDAIMGYVSSNVKGDDMPIVNISWDECQAFIQKLNQMSRLNFRLPTEAEWEFAARGGNQSRGYIYSGSDDIATAAWYVDNSDAHIHEVGTKSPNELGIFDMTGNVWEWTSDHFSANYSSPRNSSGYVYRGGSWDSSPSYCRVSARNFDDSSYRRDFIGFRLVLPIK